MHSALIPIVKKFLLISAALSFAFMCYRDANAQSWGDGWVPPSELKGVEVLYFKKYKDNVVLKALVASRIPFRMTPAESPEIASETNILTCTPDVNVAAIKTLALLMLKDGVKLRAIAPSVYGTQFKNKITLETYGGYDSYPVLTSQFINNLKRCPTEQLSLSSEESTALGETAEKIVACYAKGASGDQIVTIRQMHECSGLWVTPRMLMSCSLGAGCYPLSDTVADKATLNATLDNDKLSVDSPLSLIPETIPRMPDAEQINACKTHASSEDDFGTCVSSAVSAQYKELFDCFGKFTEGERLACFAKQVQNEDLTALIGCLNGGPPSPEKLALCTSDPKLEGKISGIRDCLSAAADGGSARSCLTGIIPAPQQKVVTCLGNASAAFDPASCLDNLSPDVRKARLVTDCLNKVDDQRQAAQCVAPYAGGDAVKVANCLLNTNNKADAGTCLLDGMDSKQVKAVQAAYKCFKEGRDAASVLSTCTEGVLDDKSRQTTSCIIRARSDRRLLAACAAGAVLPADAARIVSCASSSKGPTSFALCAAGPSMNDELRIAAECAVQAGGEPLTFAGCTAGQLTMRELTKCFAGEIGKDCFGSNNTIVVALNNAYGDVTQGPGKNNEIVKVIDKVGELTGGPNSVINNPKQLLGGGGSVFNRPEQLLGGDGSVFRDPGQVLDPGRWRF